MTDDLPLFAPRTQPTSRDTLRAITDSGTLTGARLTAYEALVEIGPCTGAELDHHIASRTWVDGARGHFHKRLPELRQLGAVVEGAARVCRVTGHRAITWAVSGALPTRRPERVVPQSTQIKDLERENERLRARVADLEREVCDLRSIEPF